MAEHRATAPAAPRTRASRAPARPRGGVPTAAALLLPPVLGACADAVRGAGPGWGVAAGAVAGALWATVLATARGGLGWVVPMPPLVVAAATVAVSLPTDDGPLATDAVRWALDAFPVMAAAEGAVLAVLAVRVIRPARTRRTGGKDLRD
ncbi:hypothetical protein I5Q34_08650 [Streptomyces sp. AV19]|uniref:hypothetical protein n=1 Tax=Streptomyces sp. AV19 TaxID=2793068 RepID=UPI0018FE214F|nr:hypothetical protein [Streptomyces sp. AV19]MBH1934359.1 hypothetical protein [Streptomyces sp. AV19]MDG4533332.1 hypothetical protein [Streptomyces sp. AV19]